MPDKNPLPPSNLPTEEDSKSYPSKPSQSPRPSEPSWPSGQSSRQSQPSKSPRSPEPSKPSTPPSLSEQRPFQPPRPPEPSPSAGAESFSQLSESAKSESEERVPQREIFPKGAFKKVPPLPKTDRFGEPEDLIPKKKAGQEGLEEFKMTPYIPEEGTTVEDLERRSQIKKIVFFVLLAVILIFVGIFVYNKWFKKTTQEQKQAPAVKEKQKETKEVKGLDSDEDGLPDKWEKQYGLDPDDSQDAVRDPDVDKLTNLQEYQYGTNPQKPDTDNDGYKDGDEVINGYNPNGPGRLQEGDEGKKNYPTMKGEWKGIMNGSVYTISDLDLILQADGNLNGKFTAKSKQGEIKSEASGSYSFRKEADIFKAKLLVNGTFIFKKLSLSGRYKLNIEGYLENKTIRGTWTLTPVDEGLSWLVADKGNFKISKASRGK